MKILKIFDIIAKILVFLRQFMNKIVTNSDIVVKNYLSDNDITRLKEVYRLSKASKTKCYSLDEMKKMVKERIASVK